MRYLDELFEGRKTARKQPKRPPQRINRGEGDSAGNPASDEYVRGGRTGTPTLQGRLLKDKSKKMSATADSRVGNYSAGPKRKLPEGTIYERRTPLKTKFKTKKGKPDKMAPSSERKEFQRLTGKRSPAYHRKSVTSFVKKYGNERPVVPGEPSTNKIPTGIDDHIEYKRMGLLMAESLGYRIDEFLPALAQGARALGTMAVKGAGKVARTAGGLVKKKATDMAMNYAEKRDKKMAAKKMDMEEMYRGKDPLLPKGTKVKKVNLKKLPKRKDGKSMEIEPRYMLPPMVEPGKRKDEAAFYFELGMLMAEAVTKKVGPIASRYSGMGRVKSKKKGKGSRSIGDPVVRREVEAANRRVGKKLGINANLETDVAAQQGLENRRRRFRRKGIGLPAPSRKEREADAREDQRRRQAPDDK